MSTNFMQPITAADIESRPALRCPTCGKKMPYHGGTAGWLCCNLKILSLDGGWVDATGRHVRDHRINNSLLEGVKLQTPPTVSKA